MKEYLDTYKKSLTDAIWAIEERSLPRRWKF